MDISPLPCIAADKLTVNSGMDVPIATTVSPITSVDTFSFKAIAAAPRVSKLAP